MARKIATGAQSFSFLRENNAFYIDKTKFIKEWWENLDQITLITRPRRFGKTLMLDTVRTFFSPEFADHGDIFEGLSIWKEEKFHKLHGKIPVIFLSFADIKCVTIEKTKYLIKYALENLYKSYRFLLDCEGFFTNDERTMFASVNRLMSDDMMQIAVKDLSKYLKQFYGVSPLVLIDEYDTPMQEAWSHNYWDELTSFMRGFFNSTFKTNPYIDRGLITGITRISRESLFSDFNNLEVITATSEKYADCFGFTEAEVFEAMDEFDLSEKQKVKSWYDGFIFGDIHDIYNPWSITQYLAKKRFRPYWANTSSNTMATDLIGQGDAKIKQLTESLLIGNSIVVNFDEEIVFSQLHEDVGAIWSFLLAAGYVKVLSYKDEISEYEITLTNHEVTLIFEKNIKEWFSKPKIANITSEFYQALMQADLRTINSAIQRISIETFSWFDTSGKEPERFYHAFVLGMLVDLKASYALESNRESGKGRYDIMLIPKDASKHPGIVIEFKSLDPHRGEKELADTAKAALEQIRSLSYAASLTARGVPEDRILTFGFAFKGKDVLVEGGKAC
ncbi:MAG: AAA family ATPase [Desulfovibrio sp.]|nr:AAA family ATPase [Desulfovibrio sp.]